MQMMSDLAHQRGRAVVIVTHDSRVLNFADRIVRIEDGVVARSRREDHDVPELLAQSLPQASVGLVQSRFTA
jgi:putative ABC transport system ATP-binding protein